VKLWRLLSLLPLTDGWGLVSGALLVFGDLCANARRRPQSNGLRKTGKDI